MLSSTVSSTPASGMPVQIERHPMARNRELPPPDDFAKYGRIETVIQLESRYKRGAVVIRRWREVLGIIGPDGRGADLTSHFQLKRLDLPVESGDATVLQRAAQWLRKKGKIGNIFQCSIEMREYSPETWADNHNWRNAEKPGFVPIPDRGVGWFKVDGHGILSADALVTLARKHGFGE